LEVTVTARLLLSGLALLLGGDRRGRFGLRGLGGFDLGIEAGAFLDGSDTLPQPLVEQVDLGLGRTLAAFLGVDLGSHLFLLHALTVSEHGVGMLFGIDGHLESPSLGCYAPRYWG